MTDDNQSDDIEGVRRELDVVRKTIRALVDGEVDSVAVSEGGRVLLRAAQERLHEREYLFRESQRAAFIGSYRADFAADHWDSSDVLEELFGIDSDYPRTIAGWLEIVHPDDRESMQRYLEEEVIAGGKPFDREYRIVRHTDHETRWVHGQGRVRSDDSGNIRWMNGIIRDITERRAASERLRQSEQLLRAIFDGAGDAIVLLDDACSCIDANPAACALTGRSREELLGLDAAKLLGSEADFVEGWQAFLTSGSADGTASMIRPDGTRREVELNATANILPGQHLAVLRDATERKRSEEMRNRLAAIVESSDDAMIGLDLEGTIQTWNRGAAMLLQYEAEETLGKNISLLIPPELVERETEMPACVARGERLAHHQTQRLRKDGTRIDISLSASPIVDETGKTIGISNIERDVTEELKAQAKLRETEEQLRQAQKMEAIGRLAGGVAHDFNNMLSIVLTYSRAMLEELNPGDPAREDLAEIAAAGERAAVLTRQLLAFSRKQVLEPQVVSLDEIVRGIERMLARVVGEDVGVSVRTTPAGKVYLDPGQFEQILMNLVVNARDAMPDGGDLTIEVSNVTLDDACVTSHPDVQAGDYTMLAVTDTGLGMDATTRARIFEPFFTTKEPGKGTGLGLSTVFGIVTQSGGHIWVDSEPGMGTTFKVYFPWTDRPDATRSRTLHPESQELHGDETILLVEDEAPVRRSVRRVLRKQGYNVLEAQNGGEALLVSEKFADKIHLLLTDVVMPYMSGRELAVRLATARPGLKTLFVSGYTEDAIVHQGVLDAGLAFLQKPLTPTALLRKVRQVLDT